MPKKFKAVTIMLIAVLLLSIVFPVAVFGLNSNNTGDRISGADRYQTALEVAKSAWAEGAETVVLAPGADKNLVDALTAAPLAHSQNAPILLTKNNELLSSVKEYLELKTETVYVVSAAINQRVISEIESLDIEVKELGGKDRFSTAVNIAKEIENVNGVFVATATGNADALSIASIAAAKGMPILLTNVNSFPAVEAEYLEEIKEELSQSYVVGGTAAVSDAVANAIPGEVIRISGSNRFATNLEVLKVFFADAANHDKIFVANGTNKHLVDALVASTLAASTDSPVILVNKDFDSNSKAYVEGKLAPAGKVVALGGEIAVSAVVQTPNYVRAEDFSVMQLSGVNGYNVGFQLPGGTADIAAVEVSLYDNNNNILAKNLSNNKLLSLGGSQFSSPFNVNGTFAGDAYWNYGLWAGTIHDVPAKAVISVTLFDGRNFTVVNSNLSGDPESLLSEAEKHVRVEDFSVMQLSGVNGYNVGFSLMDGKEANDLFAIEVSLYDQDGKLLAMNSAASKILRTNYSQLSSPFNIDGTFQADGYWNYGSWNGSVEDIPAKAVIKVIYEANGLSYTVENTNLTGDPGKLGPSEVTTDLTDEVMINEDVEFEVSTVANRYASEIVRVKVTITEGQAEDFELMYKEGETFKALSFTDGVTWYGPSSGFPLSDLSSTFKINFKEAGIYGYLVEVIRLSDDQVLASAAKSVEAIVEVPDEPIAED